jgi:hypothetical protein
MKRYALYVITTLLFVSFFNSLHAETTKAIDSVIAGYFGALKNGDVDAIKYYIAGDFYEKKKALLENNQNYPEFLKKIYQESEVRVLNSTQTGDNAVVEVGIYGPDSSISVTKMRLKKDSSDTWKIVEEITEF